MALWRPPRPTINYAHPASRGLRFSFVSQGSTPNAVNSRAVPDLYKRQWGYVAAGAPTLVRTAWIGSAVRFAGLADRIDFDSYPTTSQPATLATILVPNSVAGLGVYLQNSGVDSGVYLCNQTSGTVQMAAGGVAFLNPTLPVVANVPYLIVGSLGPNGTVNLMTVRLDTGAVATATSTNASSPTAGDTRIVLGNVSSDNRVAAADIAAALFSNTFLSLGALTEWARDPWGPWRASQAEPELTLPLNSDGLLHEFMTLSDASSIVVDSLGSMQAGRLAAEVLLSEDPLLRVGAVEAEVMAALAANLRVGAAFIEVMFPADSSGERVTLQDATDALLVSATSVFEDTLLVDEATATVTTAPPVDEAIALADATNSQMDAAASTDEAIALADATDAIVFWAGSVDEAIALADDADAIVIFTVEEAVALADAVDSTVGFLASQSEAVSLADATSNTGTFGVSAAETAPLVDTPSSTAVLPSSQGEAMALSDVETQILGDRGSVFEAIALADSVTVLINHGVSVHEVMGLLDAPATGGFTYSASVSEAMPLSDAPDSGTFSVSVAEAVALADGPSAAVDWLADVAEAVGLSDGETVPMGYDASVGEAISLADHPSTPHITPPGNAAVSVITG